MVPFHLIYVTRKAFQLETDDMFKWVTGGELSNGTYVYKAIDKVPRNHPWSQRSKEKELLLDPRVTEPTCMIRL